MGQNTPITAPTRINRTTLAAAHAPAQSHGFENQRSVRGARRAPIHVPVRVQVGGREKDGVLYSLSEGGCFIETPRASMDGARLRLIFELEQREFEIDGVVAFANVPGNLQRPNLPLGMGVRFKDVPDLLLKPLGKFIQERMNSLEV